MIDIFIAIMNDFVRIAAFILLVLTLFVSYFDPKQLLRVSTFDSICLQSSNFFEIFT